MVRMPNRFTSRALSSEAAPIDSAATPNHSANRDPVP